MVLEELLGMTSILGSYKISLTKEAYSAKRDIIEVPNWSCYNV